MIVEVTYETSESAWALQWLTPEQTAGKKAPYLFSQCQVCLWSSELHLILFLHLLLCATFGLLL